MKNTITILFSLFFLNIVAQNKVECDKLLSKEIDIEMNHLEKFQSDFSNFKNCGLDSVDLEIFSNNSILASILITLTSENKNKKITYGTLLSKILDFKKSEQYPKIREATLISKELSIKIARIENWNEDKIKLKKLEISESYLVKMYDFVKENSDSKTYKEIFMVLNEEQNKVNNLKKSEEYSDIFTNYGNTDLTDLLKKANTLNKPLIIYFTGYGCVNSRKIEKNILTEDLIYEKLKNQCYFVSLYLDDKKQLADSEQFTSSSTGRLIKTIGQKHSNLQIEKFNVNMQPYFAILDSKGNIIATESYSTDENNFMTFLNKGLKTK
jgi:thioredoxin-related protein